MSFISLRSWRDEEWEYQAFPEEGQHIQLPNGLYLFINKWEVIHEDKEPVRVKIEGIFAKKED